MISLPGTPSLHADDPGFKAAPCVPLCCCQLQHPSALNASSHRDPFQCSLTYDVPDYTFHLVSVFEPSWGIKLVFLLHLEAPLFVFMSFQTLLQSFKVAALLPKITILLSSLLSPTYIFLYILDCRSLIETLLGLRQSCAPYTTFFSSIC